MINLNYKNNKEIIAIDGPSWVGKSTIAYALSKLIKYDYVNTGCIYRSISKKIFDNNIEPGNVKEIIKVIENSKIKFETGRIFMDNKDITNYISTPEINIFTTKIAAIPEVRALLLESIREMGKKGRMIFEGRDIGTNIFPESDWKFFIHASMDIRVERFKKLQPLEKKEKYSIDEIKTIITKIDKTDRERKVSPLKIAKDAILYDNTDSPNAEQDAIILKHYITNWEEIKNNSNLKK